jgi:hypothetical protein
MANRALRVVQAPEPVHGDGELTREAASEWTPGQRKCRARGRHDWKPFTVYEHRAYLDVVERCPNCKNRRHATFVRTQWGVRQDSKWKPDYRDNYLLKKGSARVRDLEDLFDSITADDILSRRIVEVKDDDE